MDQGADSVAPVANCMILAGTGSCPSRSEEGTFVVSSKWRLGTSDGSKSTLVKGRLSESSHVIVPASGGIYILY
jgi:hypothetical protein